MGRVEHSDTKKVRYSTLEARVKHVPEATIRKKWKKLPAANHAAAREAVLSAKDQSRTRTRKATDLASQECVQEIANKLVDRLPRIPFPPGTDEHHFDLEANLSRISKVEQQLSDNVHSMNLLRAQIAKEEKLLKQDEAEVESLEHSFKATEATRKAQSRTLHPVARQLGRHKPDNDLLSLDVRSRLDQTESLVDLLVDEDLRPVLQQLQNHLVSMDQNVSRNRDIKQAVDMADHDLDRYVYFRPST